jgi:hypothetical protein
MKKTIVALILVLISCPLRAFLDTAQTGGSNGSFLYYGGSGPRSVALGNACSAICDDAASAYFNPACIADLKYKEISFYYKAPLQDVSYDVLSFALPAGDYNIFSFSRVDYTTDGIEKVSADGIKEGNFSDVQDAYMLSYAHRFSGLFSVGISGKLITHSSDTFNGHAFGIDAGALISAGEVCNFSFALQNILSPSIRINQANEVYPVNFRFGTGIFFFDKKLAVMADLIIVNLLMDKSEFDDASAMMNMRAGAGIEYKPFSFAAIRAGINDTSVSVGAGITSDNFTIDYAASFFEAAIVHNFGITARFGMLPTEKEKKVEAEKSRLENEKKTLEADKQQLIQGTLYQSALKDLTDGSLDSADSKVKTLLDQDPKDKDALKLKLDIDLARVKKEASAKFDFALQMLLKGDKEKGKITLAEAEKQSPGISAMKVKEYLDNADLEIASRNYDKARISLLNVLAVDPDNSLALPKLEKIQEIMDMIKK